MNIVWAGLANLLMVGVVLVLYRVPSTDFETAVLSGIIAIYITVRYGLAALTYMGVGRGMVLHGMLLSIQTLMNDPSAGEYRDAMLKPADDFAAGAVRLQIDAAGTVIVWLIVLWHLLALM